MTAAAADVVIVGGGVIGCAVAYFAAARGLDVLLVEKRYPGAGASGANAGGVTVSAPEPGPQSALMLLSARLTAGLREALGRDIEYVQAGGLRALLTPNEVDDARSFAARRQAEGIACEILDPQAARELEPGLAGAVIGGLHTPADGHLNPLALTGAYLRRAVELGARTAMGTAVLSFIVRGDRIGGVRTTAGDYAAATTVLAAGAWSAALAETIALALPIVPTRGTLMATERLAPFSRRTLRCGSTIVRQLPGGTAVIGSNVENAAFDNSAALPAMASYARMVGHFVPALREVRILRAFAGLRPHPPDSLPILGHVRGYEGLVLACGHDRHGVGWSAATGLLIAELLSGSETTLSLQPFTCDRFRESRRKECMQ